MVWRFAGRYWGNFSLWVWPNRVWTLYSWKGILFQNIVNRLRTVYWLAQQKEPFLASFCQAHHYWLENISIKCNILNLNVDCKYKIIIWKKSARTSEVLKERSLTKTLLIIEFSLRKEMFLKSEKGDRIRRILFKCINNIQNSTFVQCFELKHTSTNVDRYIIMYYKPLELFLYTYRINRKMIDKVKFKNW